MQIDYSRVAAKYLSGLDKPVKQRLKKKIEGLTKTPPKGDIKPLRNYPKDTMRLRTGQYRIIYRYEVSADGKRMLYISDIDSRRNIYK